MPLSAALVLTGAGLALLPMIDQAVAEPVSVSRARPVAGPPVVGPEPAHARPAPATPRPRRIMVPRVGIAAEVVAVGTDADGRLEVPHDEAQAGWWRKGSAPGERGPAVIVGHVDSRTGPAVFYRLRELRAGDLITVSGSDGSVRRFAVDRVERHSKDEFPSDSVYAPTREPTLRLVTCGGAFDRSAGSYRDNVVVLATLSG